MEDESVETSLYYKYTTIIEVTELIVEWEYYVSFVNN